MAIPRAYCTYFDRGYLTRGLALIESLREHGDDSAVWVLAHDQETKDYLDHLGQPNLYTLSISDLEAAEPALLPLKAQRSRMEYYFTCTPQLMRYVMNNYSEPSTTIIYLDADLFFFGDPTIVLDALGDGSVGIIEHRYPPRLARRLAQYGRFNVGWVGIRADGKGQACLDWWAAQCLDWCFDKPDHGRYADQGYLDSFLNFEGVVVLAPAGLNLAPWNTAGHRLSSPDGSSVLVDAKDPLVFFHFHGLRRVGTRYVTSQLVFGSRLNKILRRQVYVPYLKRLEKASVDAGRVLNDPGPHPKRGNGWRGTADRLRKWLLDRITVMTGNAISVKDFAAE